MKTYDIHFNDSENSNNLGWQVSYDECLDYIKRNNGTDESYFGDYQGGIVSIYCNETEEEVYQEPIRNKIYYIYMHEGDRHGGYVFSEADVENGGCSDPDPDLYGLATREEAEDRRKMLRDYCAEKGYCDVTFTIE